MDLITPFELVYTRCCELVQCRCSELFTMIKCFKLVKHELLWAWLHLLVCASTLVIQRFEFVQYLLTTRFLFHLISIKPHGNYSEVLHDSKPTPRQEDFFIKVIIYQPSVVLVPGMWNLEVLMIFSCPIDWSPGTSRKTEVKGHGWGQQGQIFKNWPREPFLSLNESSWHPDHNSHMSELVS